MNQDTSGASKYVFEPRTDRITFEVLRHRLWQVNDEQGRTIINASGSPVAAESNDFNVAIADAQGTLVCIGPYIIVQQAALSLMVKGVLERFGPEEIEEGDMYLCNDPWLGAVHQNDACVLAPVHKDGKLVAWTGSVIHQIDVGGMSPGSWCHQATETFQEAPRYRYLKVVRGGKTQKEVVETYLTNSRTPDSLELDLRAQIAAANVTRERLLELFERHGLETVQGVMQDMVDYSEMLLRRKLLEIPDGQWYAESYLDHDGREERICAVRLTLTKKGDELVFDYRSTDPQVPAFINCPYSGVFGATFSAVVSYLCNDIPWNGGVFRPLRVLATEGTLHHARFPAPVSGGVQLICDTLNVASAAVGKMLSCSDSHKDNTMAVWTGSSLTYSMFGTNQYGEAFGTLMINTSLGGGGARYFADGHDNAGTVGAPRYSCINVESAELIYPMLYIYRKRAIDSGGPGKFRGGVSAESLIVPYGVETLPVSVTTSGCDQSNSVGIDGGYPGGGASSLVRYGTDIWDLLKHGDFPTCWDDIRGEAHVLPPKQSFVLRGSDVYNGVPHGGGGFGDPLDRDPELVRQDVVNGFVSLGSARERYGVLLDPQTIELMADATSEQRTVQRTGRLRTADCPGPLKAQLVGPGGATRRLGENLQIQGEAIQCVRCSAVICQNGENPKSFCAVRRVPLKNANPWTALRWKGESEHFDLVEYICPACGGLLYVDERLKAETSHWHDYHLQ